ncbi:MAG: kinase [Proteobacteria bacterium]|nr:kinase [Pseudomonadota bacterium]
MDDSRLTDFCKAHRLPDSFRQVVAEYYVALARWLLETSWRITPIIGICGAQGTGKSTLAEFLAEELDWLADWSVAVLSMDDFYLSRTERLELSRKVHPLLATRGPPGTHDCEMMGDYLERLRRLGDGESMALPRFDKSRDDRAPPETWPHVIGPLDAVILEGWCLGVPPQNDGDLVSPINELEANRDGDGRWRTHVNNRLREDYAEVFSRLDRLVFLQAPNMESVLRWRNKQERKLIAETSAREPGVMNTSQLQEFVQHFERLSRVAIAELPAFADVTLMLDSSHQVREIHYRT